MTTPKKKSSAKLRSSVQKKFTTMRTEMSNGLIERHGEVDLVLTALLCQEHVNLVGEPGTAKSLLLDTLLEWFEDGNKFTILMSKHTNAEEVFGPVSVAGLKKDQYRRITTNKLPEADFAFCDEIYKAGPAILNSLLRILNEREFDGGAGDLTKCPLKLCVAASNEWPGHDGEGGLGALFDRFLFRKTVKPVSRGGRERLLQADILKPELTTTMTGRELEAAFESVNKIKVSDAAWQSLDAILDKLSEEGIVPGDRRMRKSVKAAKAFAYLNGSRTVEPQHLEILSHVLWQDPNEQPEVCEAVIVKLIDPEATRASELLMQATDVIENSRPVDAVPKLKAIQDEFANMTSARSRAASQHVTNEIQRLYGAVIGN